LEKKCAPHYPHLTNKCAPWRPQLEIQVCAVVTGKCAPWDPPRKKEKKYLLLKKQLSFSIPNSSQRTRRYLETLRDSSMPGRVYAQTWISSSS